MPNFEFLPEGLRDSEEFEDYHRQAVINFMAGYSHLANEALGNLDAKESEAIISDVRGAGHDIGAYYDYRNLASPIAGRLAYIVNVFELRDLVSDEDYEEWMEGVDQQVMEAAARERDARRASRATYRQNRAARQESEIQTRVQERMAQEEERIRRNERRRIAQERRNQQHAESCPCHGNPCNCGVCQSRQ